MSRYRIEYAAVAGVAIRYHMSRTVLTVTVVRAVFY